MKPAERDELLIRLDERVCNIWTLTEKQESHLSLLNDAISKHAIQIDSNKTNIKWIRIIGGGLFTIASAVVLKLLGIY